MSPEVQRLWDADPSPSWDELAERVGVVLDPLNDTPNEPCGDVLVQTGKLWPRVHPALQEPFRA